MPRHRRTDKPLPPAPVIALELSPRLIGYLDKLVRTGLFGATREQVVAQLIGEALRDLIAKGVLER